MTITEWLQEILLFLNNDVVPVLFGLAFLFFIWNATRFFIFQGASEEGREKAKRFMLWGIIAFVLLVSFWGIINLLVGGIFGIGRDTAPCPDYLKQEGGCESFGGLFQ